MRSWCPPGRFQARIKVFTVFRLIFNTLASCQFTEIGAFHGFLLLDYESLDAMRLSRPGYLFPLALGQFLDQLGLQLGIQVLCH